MVITLADNSTTTVNVENGKGISSIAKVSTAGLVDTYQITYNDNSTPTTFTVTNGAKGDTGDSWYVWIKYAGSQPTQDSDMGDTPDDWIGIYSGISSTAPAHYTDYEWYEYKGEKGDTGDAATIITQNVSYQESSSGTVAPSGSWTTTIPTVTPGNFLWTRTQLAFNDGTTVTAYSVSRYGIDGSGAVSSVNNVSPDSNGNVALTGTDIPLSDNQSIQTHVTDAEDDIDALKTSINSVESGLAIIVNGDTCSTAVPVGGYAYIKNNTHGLSEGLYVNTSASSFPTSGGTANSTVFTPTSGVLTGLKNLVTPNEYTAAASSGVTKNSALSYKIGRIVICEFDITTSSSMSSNTTLLSGVPGSISTWEFFGENASTREVQTFYVNSSGQIRNSGTMAAGTWIGDVVYISYS